MFDLSMIFKGMKPNSGAGAGGWAANTVVKPEGSLFTQGLDGSISGLNGGMLGSAFQTAGKIIDQQQNGQPMSAAGAFEYGARRGHESSRDMIRRLAMMGGGM